MSMETPENDEEKRDRLFGLVFRDGKNKLYKQDLIMRKKGELVYNSIATYMSPNSAVIDSRAYEILRKKCGDNINKLNLYLKAILYFEINHSDDSGRHRKRLPIEKEIITLLEEEGYFV